MVRKRDGGMTKTGTIACAALVLALTLLLRYRREKKFALCTLPTWGIIFSLLFSACILIRYSYPFMTCAPMFLLLVLFSDRRAA